MGKKNRLNSLQRIPSSPGFVRTTGVGSGGLTLQHPAFVTELPNGALQIDRTKLTAPKDIYDADCGWVARRLGAVSLFFAKANLDDATRFRTRLEIRYSEEMFRHHLWQNSREFHEKLGAGAAGVTRPEELVLEPQKIHSDRDHSVWASIEFMSQSGSTVQVDFFHMTPESMVLAKSSKASLSIEPVVRVLTTAAVMKNLLDSVDVISAAVQPTADRWLEVRK